jgi:hypothetical protein
MSVSRRGALAALWMTCVAGIVAAPRPQETPSAAVSAKTWVGRQQEIEDYLKRAEVVRMEETKVGVTRPAHAYLAPGGPISEMAWKALPASAVRNGYRESYKAELAAYEMDKLLMLNMVPPKVERRVKGDDGVAVMWASPTRSFKEMGGPPTPPARYLPQWNLQMIRAKMFDDLIGNEDPNLGNWLVDPSWNLILIDHSRTFRYSKSLTHELTHIDRALWDRMKGLTREQIAATLGSLLDERDINGILDRREVMQRSIDKLVKSKGEAAVFTN